MPSAARSTRTGSPSLHAASGSTAAAIRLRLAGSPGAWRTGLVSTSTTSLSPLGSRKNTAPRISPAAGSSRRPPGSTGADPVVLRADSEGQLAVSAHGEAARDPRGDGRGPARSLHRELLSAGAQLARQQVHRRLADELGDE